jgi:membrane peptidoglycan carboxypeptidase
MRKHFLKVARLTRSVLTPALLVAALLLTASAGYVQKRHIEAEQFLDQIDLRARNTNGATFYASKKRLFVGQGLSRFDVVEHLQSVNYAHADEPGQPGSYTLQGTNSLLITPRTVEFEPLSISFRRDRIAKIVVTADTPEAQPREVKETSLEPVSLGAFITSIEGDEASKMFVRRYIAQTADFKGTQLFYAILASEDTSFMDHNGTRFDRILLNLLPGRRGGGSSITAQVIKNAVSLDRTHAVTRKLDEVFLASALERRMSKDEILTLYVNNVFLGGGLGSPNVYGFVAAAEEYFGKKAIRELSLSEACTLVGMLPRPGFFLRQVKKGDYGQLTAARDRVLRRLTETWPKRYPASVTEAATKEVVRFVSKPYVEQPMDILARGFVDYAARQQPLLVLNDLPPVEYSGLRLYTSIDPDLMRESQRLLNVRLPGIEQRFPPLRRAACDGQEERLLGAVIALNPRTGEVIAMSGGSGGKNGVKYANFALNAVDAPASTIKPFWVAQALSGAGLPGGGRFTAASIVDPTHASLGGWRPDSGIGGPGRPRTKLAASADDFAVYLLKLIGTENGRQLYRTVTGSNVADPTGQFSIGFGAGTEVSPLNLARAYTVFGNNGVLADISPISQIYLNGSEVTPTRRPAARVFDEGAAYVTVQMMRSVMGYGPDGRHGTARGALAQAGLAPEQIEIAGKTGSGPHSVWMVSVSPRLVVAVWLGYLCRSPIKNSESMYARDTAASVWGEFIKSVHKYRPDLLEGWFERPSNVTEVGINPRRGCRSDNAGSIKEFFVTGTEPILCK